MQNLTPGVCPDAARIVGAILRGMRRRGLPPNVDADDLRQEGMIAIVTAARVDTPAHAATIAKNAMLDHLRKGLRRNKSYYTGIQSTEDSGAAKITVDPWHVLDVDGQEARHREWERERRERWGGWGRR